LCKRCPLTNINSDVFLTQNIKNSQKTFTFNKFKTPIKIKVIGKVNKFLIIFKPYGLVQFLPNLLEWSTQEFSTISLFKDLVVLEKKINIDAIENYLVSKLCEKKGTETIIKAINILKEDEKISLEELSNLCNCYQKNCIVCLKVFVETIL